MEEKLALELLREVKAYGKRWFYIAMAELFIIFAIIIYSNLPIDEDVTTSTEYDVQSNDDGNAVYNNLGKVAINGESESKDNKNNETETKRNQTDKTREKK